jgi:hypothetical protein
MLLRTRAARAVAIWLALALSLGPLSASGAPPAPLPSTTTSEPLPPDATELRRRGNDAMAAFKPGEALDDYKQAYDLTKDPALLYNMARALEVLEDYPSALARYEDFARLASPELKSRVPKLDELIAALRTRVSKLSVTCNVPGARVIVREKTVGQTLAHGEALVVALAAGRGVLEVDADGYNPFQRNVALPGGGAVSVEVTLVPKAVAGLLVVGSEPGGGTVFVDGHELGTAPVEASVGAGTHQVAVRLPGFVDATTSVVVSVGERRVVTVTLGQGTPITKKWWFWTGIGAVVATGAIVSYAALTERGPGTGSIPPGQGRP